jgi:TPR repeat protein
MKMAGALNRTTQAKIWYQKAADQGYAAAQTNIGRLYENGSGVDKDYAKALAWYQKAADQGDAGAQFSVGLFYESGWGVEKDYAKALAWYRRAADQGYEDAKTGLNRLQGK